MISLSEKIARINQLDLEPIKFKLVKGDEGPTWSIEKADRAEVEYKRFLILNLQNRINKKLPSIVPSKDVDEFWHYHILDTMKYCEDCEYCLGYFLHHFPYLGLRGEEDARLLKNRYRQSVDFYKEQFGAPLIPFASEGEGCDAPQCAPDPSCESARPEDSRRDRPVLVR